MDKASIYVNEQIVWDNLGPLETGLPVSEIANQAFINFLERYPDKKCKLIINGLIVREWHPHV